MRPNQPRNRSRLASPRLGRSRPIYSRKNSEKSVPCWYKLEYTREPSSLHHKCIFLVTLMEEKLPSRSFAKGFQAVASLFQAFAFFTRSTPEYI